MGWALHSRVGSQSSPDLEPGLLVQALVLRPSPTLTLTLLGVRESVPQPTLS